MIVGKNKLWFVVGRMRGLRMQLVGSYMQWTGGDVGRKLC